MECEQGPASIRPGLLLGSSLMETQTEHLHQRGVTHILQASMCMYWPCQLPPPVRAIFRRQGHVPLHHFGL